MNVRDACLPRTIDPIEVATPLLIPSFSSRGFPHISNVHQLMRDYLFDVSLISAYDLHHGSLSEPDIYATDTVFIDSGGYEAWATFDLGEPYADVHPGQIWDFDDYVHVLSRLTPLANLVIVNFDFTEPTLISAQADHARQLFAQYPGFAGDFLCKPESSSSPYLPIKSVVDQIHVLATFDLVGVTEKELGPTLLDRCRSILQLREALHRRGFQTPLHVFGCLDPMTILAYFLCGADVFDGLVWLRFAFSEGIPVYHPTRMILNETWADRDGDVVAAQRIENLNWMRVQARAMRRYCSTYDWDEFAVLPSARDHLVRLVETAGLQL